ncbi:hypothetical protein CK503_09175 [Aliifodinibius salipaludis]|uniref:Uncharacterized protein n=1 Tax=Fodinibius salipaludis TaxID=2032627 RepID=A0A2A2GAH3_9BACT|nr:hypothetical protein [Aliifodinibius salipaludis]PAU93835.1 hypothetical protein CK503_09175 [Aliifodinibius salipaludis]
MIKHILFVILLIGGVYYYWTTHPVEHGPGVVAPEAPVQEVTYNADTFNYKGFDITPKANIDLEARILSIKNYYFDQYSDLAPTDIVVGWGPMSDERNLSSMMVRQSDRSFYYEMAKPPIEKTEMWKNASNMHLIGSTKQIREKINTLREGHIIRIEGYLVNASSTKEGWTLKSSLKRDDIGKNASELVWIKSLTIL